MIWSYTSNLKHYKWFEVTLQIWDVTSDLVVTLCMNALLLQHIILLLGVAPDNLKQLDVSTVQIYRNTTKTLWLVQTGNSTTPVKRYPLDKFQRTCLSTNFYCEKKEKRSICESGKEGATVPTRTWTGILSLRGWCSSTWATGTGARPDQFSNTISPLRLCFTT